HASDVYYAAGRSCGSAASMQGVFARGAPLNLKTSSAKRPPTPRQTRGKEDLRAAEPSRVKDRKHQGMARIVMKFGGTSVADPDRIHNVARHVKREVDLGHEVAVVVSAMAGKTNELVGWVQNMPKVAGSTAPVYDAREYDAVVASGEQVTAGLLAIALQSMGVHARSWQGWQVPIRTDNAHGAARIADIDGSFLIKRFGEGQVAVIAG